MDLDDLIITAFCMIDDNYKACFCDRSLRERGPRPQLSDSEVLTMEVVGAYLGLDQDKDLFAFFQHHYAHFFPAMGRLHRTTFVRQAANLHAAKERLWQHVIQQVPHDDQLHIVDSFILPVCRFARAPRCRRFRGQAAYGRDGIDRQTFFGFRFHALVSWPGIITRVSLAPGNVQELAILENDLSSGISGTILGDRNYWSPTVRDELAREGIQLTAPFRKKTTDPNPKLSTLLSRLRYRIETVFGQLCDRYHAKKVWARNIWHLASRLIRIILSHTICTLINYLRGNELLQFEQLVTE